VEIQLYGGPSDGLKITIPMMTSHITIPVLMNMADIMQDEHPLAHVYTRSPRPGYFDYVGVK
jgi:hypothetical protein